MCFVSWFYEKKDVVCICCLIGICMQESFNCWCCIYFNCKYQMYYCYWWILKVGNDIFNVYFIYDWKIMDVWIVNGKFKWDYNKLYDYYYWVGVNLECQCVVSLFIGEV